MSRKYKFHNKEGLYFVSFATVNWIDVFTREKYFTILAESIDYCRKYKGMELYAYCFMPSHVHLMFRDSNEKPTELLRDFKKHTAKKVLEAIANNPLYEVCNFVATTYCNKERETKLIKQKLFLKRDSFCFFKNIYTSKLQTSKSGYVKQLLIILRTTKS